VLGNSPSRGKLGQKSLSGLAKREPPWAHRTVSDAQAISWPNRPLLENWSGALSIIHWTVQCALDCPVIQAANGSRQRQ
jgi:hypothetical protein